MSERSWKFNADGCIVKLTACAYRYWKVRKDRSSGIVRGLDEIEYFIFSATGFSKGQFSRVPQAFEERFEHSLNCGELF